MSLRINFFLLSLLFLGQIQTGSTHMSVRTKARALDILERIGQTALKTADNFFTDPSSEARSTRESNENGENPELRAVRSCIVPVVRELRDDPYGTVERFGGQLRDVEHMTRDPSSFLVTAAKMGVERYLRSNDFYPKGRKPSGLERALDCVQSLGGVERQVRKIGAELKGEVFGKD